MLYDHMNLRSNPSVILNQLVGYGRIYISFRNLELKFVNEYDNSTKNIDSISFRCICFKFLNNWDHIRSF